MSEKDTQGSDEDSCQKRCRQSQYLPVRQKQGADVGRGQGTIQLKERAT